MSNNFLGVSHLNNEFNQKLTAKDPAFALRYELSILARKSMRCRRATIFESMKLRTSWRIKIMSTHLKIGAHTSALLLRIVLVLLSMSGNSAPSAVFSAPFPSANSMTKRHRLSAM